MTTFLINKLLITENDAFEVLKSCLDQDIVVESDEQVY